MKKALLIAGGVVLAVPLLAVAGFLVFFDANAFRPQLAEAVQRATGREFRIEGALRLSPALTPTIAADGLVLANSAGGSAPDMLRIGHAELRLALLPLISGRIEVKQLTLEGGRLLLERENWRFARPAPSPTQAPLIAPAATAAAPPRPPLLELHAILLRDWRVTWNGEELRIPQMRLVRPTLLAADSDQPLDVTATLIGRGAEALIEGRIGPPMAMGGPAPWPFRIGVVLPGARLSAEGQQTGADWRGNLGAEIPRLDALSNLAGQPLPPLTGISLRAQAALTGGVASLTALEGSIGGGEFAGVALTGIRFTQTALDAPIKAEATAQFRGQPVALTAEASPAALYAGQPTPITLRGSAGNATAALTGNWPGAMRLEAAAPDLTLLAPLAGQPLPALRDVALRADFLSLGPMFREGARIGEFTLTSSAGDLAGALELRWQAKPSVTGRLVSTRLDLTPLRMPAAPPSAAPAAPAPAPAAPSRPAPASGRVIPETLIDLTALRAFDADLTFAFAELIQGTLVLRQVEGHLVNQGGRAQLDPMAATLPGGRLSLRAAADATTEPPALQVTGGGQGLDPAALLGAFGTTSPVTGRTDLDLDLRGQGATLRAMAATATGHFGLAVTEGRLAGAPAQALAQLPGFANGVPVTCLALRGDADRGLVRFPAFYLEGGAGRLGGEGGMSLRDETLAIRMMTDLRVAGVRVRAPVPLTGTLAQPRLELQGLTEGALGAALGAPSPPGMTGLSDCAASLRIARGGREGPVPASQPLPPSNAQPALNNLLRGIFGR